MIRLTTYGVGEVVTSLRNVAERVTDAARKRMIRGAEKIVKEARLNAPVDKFNLEESIRIEKTYGTRRRLQMDVVAGGMVHGINVDEYAAEMHENYESYNAGEGTVEKRAKHPERYVGGKFLERAAEDVGKKIRGEIEIVVEEIIPR